MDNFQMAGEGVVDRLSAAWDAFWKEERPSPSDKDVRDLAEAMQRRDGIAARQAMEKMAYECSFQELYNEARKRPGIPDSSLHSQILKECGGCAAAPLVDLKVAPQTPGSPQEILTRGILKFCKKP